MRIIASCIILAIFLCGCGTPGQMDRAILLRQQLTQCDGCSFLCAITVDYLDKVQMFSLICNFDSLGNMSFQVAEPESIAGISGKIDQTGGKLTFDDQALAFELLADGYISPVSAPWFFMKAIRGGHIGSCGQDGEFLRITLYDTYAEDAMQVDIWLDEENTPVRCEMIWQGRRILSLEVSRFSYM